MSYEIYWCGCIIEDGGDEGVEIRVVSERGGLGGVFYGGGGFLVGSGVFEEVEGGVVFYEVRDNWEREVGVFGDFFLGGGVVDGDGGLEVEVVYDV